MTKDELIQSIKEKYSVVVRKESAAEWEISHGWSNIPERFINSIIERVEPFLRNAYNLGYKEGREATYVNFKDELQRSFNAGLKRAEDSAHYKIESGKTDGYNEGLKDAWETARKVITYYPTEDMARIFGLFSGILNLDKVFLFSAEEAMAKLSEYEARKNLPTNRDKFKEVFGMDYICGNEFAEFNGVTLQEWLRQPYNAPKSDKESNV